MNAAKRLGLTGVVVVVLACHAAAQEGFKLVVRGGENVGLRLKGVDGNTVDLIVDFQAGRTSVRDGLRPGQGSWMDRGMHPDEPTRLIYRVRRAQAEKIAASLRNPRASWAFWCSNTGDGYMSVTRDEQAGGPRPSRID